MIIDFTTLPRKRQRRYMKIKYRKFIKKFGMLDTNRDIIKSSEKIRRLLIARFNEVDMKPSDVILDARKNGLILNKAGFSRYFSSEIRDGNILTQYQILWLCTRWSVSVTFRVTKEDYNEKKCLKSIEQLNQIK